MIDFVWFYWKRDLRVDIQLEEPFILDFDRYYVDLFRLEDVNESMIPFMHDGWSWTDHPIHDYVTIDASSLINANSNSLNHLNKFWVDFHNCTHGTYCVVVGYYFLLYGVTLKRVHVYNIKYYLVIGCSSRWSLPRYLVGWEDGKEDLWKT